MGDTDRHEPELERRIRKLEERITALEQSDAVQAEHIKTLVELRNAHLDFNKMLNELKLDFVKLKTQIMTIAAVPGVVVTVVEVVRALR